MQFKGKLKSQTWENYRRPNFRPVFDPFGPQNISWVFPPLDIRHYSELSLYVISKEHVWFKLKKMVKKLILSLNKAHRDQIRVANFFIFLLFKNLASPVTRYHGQFSSCNISEKTNDPILRKFSDGKTDGRTDGREWFHRTLSDWCRASNTALPDTPRLYVSIFGNEARFEDYVHTFSTNRILYFVPKR